MKLQIKAALSESQKAQIVARGEVLKTEYTFEMSHKYAAVFVNLNGYQAYRVKNDKIIVAKLGDLKIGSYNFGKYVSDYFVESDFSKGIAEGELRDGGSVDHIMKGIQDRIDARCDARMQELKRDAEASKQAEYDRPAREAREAREVEKSRVEKSKQDVKEAKQKESREAEIKTAKAEKLAWVKEHGSERLRKGIAAGYHCQKIYVAERGDADLGSEYEMDYDSKIGTKDRSCPTLDALNEAERLTEAGIKAKVVWLPRGLEFEDDCCYGESVSGEAVEAILIGHYFYKTY